VAYPALAGALSLGSDGALPWTLLGLDVLAVLALSAGAAAFLRAEGRSGWWALAIGLSPGLMLALLRDLSDPVATAAGLGGLMAWHHRRRGIATALLTLAVLRIGEDVEWRSGAARRPDPARPALRNGF